MQREARRHDHLVTLGQIDGIEAVLIRNGQARQPVQLGAAFGDEDDPAVEQARLAGHALIDQVGDLVADAAPLLGRGRELVGGQLALAVGVVQAEAEVVAAVRPGRHRAVQHRLGADRGPLRKIGRIRQRQTGLDETRRVQWLEIAGTAQVGPDHSAQVSPVLAVEIDHGDLHRPQHALIDLDLDRIARLGRNRGRLGSGRAHRHRQNGDTGQKSVQTHQGLPQVSILAGPYRQTVNI